LTPADAQAYWETRNQGLKEFPDAFTTTYEEGVATPPELLAERIKGMGDDFVMGAFASNGRLIGYAGFQRETRAKLRHKGKVLGMYVAPEARGTGLGRRLLVELIERVRALDGMELLLLTVTHSNEAARRLYLSVGFVPFGVEPNAIKVDGVAHAKEHMALPLQPAIARQ
jgi:ribosomal protein S18 acetylase RimI-like enzyme